MSASVSRSARSGDADPPEPGGGTRVLTTARSGAGGSPATLRVQTVFHGLDEQQAQAIAAELIDRAHELANQPESECDVDVSVQLAPASPGADANSAR
ncbi:MAG TPA: hypothetical protein VMB51_02495 [Solirubrobacteraceae bacterium]|nr:hypothetical protein [Solirubrobacteraceae bacterium]